MTERQFAAFLMTLAVLTASSALALQDIRLGLLALSGALLAAALWIDPYGSEEE